MRKGVIISTEEVRNDQKREDMTYLKRGREPYNSIYVKQYTIQSHRRPGVACALYSQE